MTWIWKKVLKIDQVANVLISPIWLLNLLKNRLSLNWPPENIFHQAVVMWVSRTTKKFQTKFLPLSFFSCAKVVGEWAPDLTLELGFSLSYTLTAAAPMSSSLCSGAYSSSALWVLYSKFPSLPWCFRPALLHNRRTTDDPSSSSPLVSSSAQEISASA